MRFWDKIAGSEQDRQKLLRYLRAVGWWAAAGLGAILLVVVAVAVFAPGQWRVYTDGIEVNQRHGETVLRNVVWQDPKRLSGSVNLDVDNYEPTMTADGRMMIFARWRASKNADLFVTHWDGREWSVPKPLGELNTPGAELGPEISRDGKYLYFYSNRPGGHGGYDIWLSRWTGRQWSKPVNLGEEVNGEFNEYGPCLSPDGGMLLFSSNRPKRELTEEERNRWRATLREVDLRTDYDIYKSDVFFDKADLQAPGAKRPEPESRPVTALASAPVSPTTARAPLPPQPQFTKALSLDVLNSPGFDGQIALTPRADFIYFSSNREGGQGNFDIYRSRLYHGEFLPPENVGPPVNTESNEMDPTLSVYGYWLVFSSNRDREKPRQYLLYETITREVMAVNDFAGLYALLSLLDNIKWWLLLLLVAAAAVAYMLYLILGESGRRQSLLAKCMLGSALAHVLLLMILSVWMITIEVGRAAGQQMMVISIDADTLASEKLALEIREQISNLPVAEDAMAVGKQALLPVQEIEPMATPPAPSVDAAFQVKPTDLEVRPKPMQKPPQHLSQTPDVREIQPLKLAAADIKLESRQPKEAKPKPEAKVVDPFRVTRLKQPEPKVAPRPAPLRPAAEGEAVVRQTADFKAPEAPQQAKAVAPARADVPLMKLQELKLAAAEVTFETPRRPVEATEDALALRPAVPARTSQPADTAAIVEAKPVAHQPNVVEAAKAQPESAVDKFAAAAAKADDTSKDLPGAGEIHKPVEPVRLAANVELEPAPTGRGKDADVTIQRVTDDRSVAAMAGLGERKSAPQKMAQTPVEGPLPELDAQIAATPGRVRLAARSPEAGHLTGQGPAIVRKTPGFKIDDTGQLESRKVSISPHLLRDPELRKGVLKGLGGSKETEADVARALKWFTKNQEADGRWSCQKHGGQANHDIVATAFATLCYYGWGAKHTEKGPHQEPLAKGIKWLVAQMKPNGDLTGGVQNGMYDHGVATMALAEGYALTKDPALKEATRKAAGFIVKAQSKEHGGWRYKPDSKDGDTSVFGWQVMALMSARMAGFKVPDESFRLASAWLDRVGGGPNGGHYGYTNKTPKPAMVAEGMFCQQLMGVPPEHKRMQESAAFLKTALPAGGKKNFYYWYYGCLSLYQHQGPVWEEWNERIKKVLQSSQIRTGKDAGSWNPDGQWGKGQSGRAVTTAMATLSLEVYYRFLPMYRSMRAAPSPPKGGKKP